MDQLSQQGRPFMAKETFDQVSAAMWGRNALDYQNNYINPRAYWSDSGIREEAIYYEGLACGLCLGASQKPIQSTSLGGNPTLPFGGNISQYGGDPFPMGYYSSGRFEDGYKPPRSTPEPESDVRSGLVFQSQKTPEMGFRFDNPQHASDLPFWASSRNDREYNRYQANLPNSMSQSGFPMATAEQELEQYRMHQAQQQAAMQNQQKSFPMAHQEQSQMTSPWNSMAPTLTELPPLQNGTAPQTTTSNANTQQTANPTATQAQVPGLAETSGELPASNGEAPSTPPIDNFWTFQSPAAGHEESDALNTTVEYASEDLSDEDYYRIDSPSVGEQRGNDGDSTSSIGWCSKEQIVGDGSHDPQIW